MYMKNHFYKEYHMLIAKPGEVRSSLLAAIPGSVVRCVNRLSLPMNRVMSHADIAGGDLQLSENTRLYYIGNLKELYPTLRTKPFRDTYVLAPLDTEFPCQILMSPTTLSYVEDATMDVRSILTCAPFLKPFNVNVYTKFLSGTALSELRGEMHA